MNKLFIATILAASLIGTQVHAEWMAIAAGVENEQDSVAAVAGLGTGYTKEEAAQDAVNNCAKNTPPLQVLCEFQTAWNVGCGYGVTGVGHTEDGQAVAAFGTGKTKALAIKAFLDAMADKGVTPERFEPGSKIGGSCVKGDS